MIFHLRALTTSLSMHCILDFRFKVNINSNTHLDTHYNAAPGNVRPSTAFSCSGTHTISARCPHAEAHSSSSSSSCCWLQQGNKHRHQSSHSNCNATTTIAIECKIKQSSQQSSLCLAFHHHYTCRRRWRGRSAVQLNSLQSSSVGRSLLLSLLTRTNIYRADFSNIYHHQYTSFTAHALDDSGC